MGFDSAAERSDEKAEGQKDLEYRYAFEHDQHLTPPPDSASCLCSAEHLPSQRHRGAASHLQPRDQFEVVSPSSPCVCGGGALLHIWMEADSDRPLL